MKRDENSCVEIFHATPSVQIINNAKLELNTWCANVLFMLIQMTEYG